MQHLQSYLLIFRRQKLRSRAKQTPGSWWRRMGLGLGVILSLFFMAGILGASLTWMNISGDLPSLDELPLLMNSQNGQLLQPTQLLDRSGETVLLTVGNPGVTRKFLSTDPQQVDHFNPLLVQATLAIAEPDYWSSNGYSLQNWNDPNPTTIAERLVLDLLLYKESADLRRAIRMRLLAAQLTQRFGRAQVLEWYLNSADYGHWAIGADSAAQLYFGKSAAEVDLAESAVLVAAAESPQLNPWDAPDRISERQESVLNRMLLSGSLSAGDYTQARLEKVTIKPTEEPQTQLAPAFTRLVLQQLDSIYGHGRAIRGGLKIITSLDSDLQQETLCALRTQLALLEASPMPQTRWDGAKCKASLLLPNLPPVTAPFSEQLQASAIITDPVSGQVLAMVGDSNLEVQSDSVSGHAPGSVVTPFVALAGFVSGMSPANLMWDIPSAVPTGLNSNVQTSNGFHGPVRLRMALANDYIAPFAQLLDQLGPSVVWRLVEPMGISSLSRVESGSTLLYQGGQVGPLELAQAYEIFANQGIRTGSSLTGGQSPVAILSIQDFNGNLVADGTQTQSQVVLSPQLAYLVHSILSDESARWQSLGSGNPLEIGRPSGGKLGQTGDGLQTWAVGYTPQRVSVIWMGLPSGDVRLDARATGGIGHAVLEYASRDQMQIGWSVPAGIQTVKVCDPSGLLPTVYCPNVVNEVFISGNQPTGWDDLYRQVDVDRETNRLATVFTPPELVEQRVYLFVPAEARAWAQAAGLPLPPTEYDNIQPKTPLVNAHITSPSIFAYVRGKVSITGTAAGEDFTSYRLQAGKGINPGQWLEISMNVQTSVSESILATWDTTGLDGLYALRLLVQRTDRKFDTATIQVTVDNTAPQVSIPYPQTDQELKIPSSGMLILQAIASDNIGIDRVEWWLDDQLIGTQTSYPYTLPWTAESGSHILFVRAYDLAGNKGESTRITFNITP